MTPRAIPHGPHAPALPAPTMADVVAGVCGWVASDPANHFADVSVARGVVRVTASTTWGRKPHEFTWTERDYQHGIRVRNRLRVAMRREEALGRAINLIDDDTE